jgi:glycosyltransferase involved in cell wall biosynthesis
MPAVLAEEPDAALRLVGSGAYETELRRLAEQLGVSDRVRIGAIPPDDREAMAAALAASSLFVLMSAFENNPLAVLEAVAMGVPALVADTAGMRELAERGLARAVPVDADSDAIASAIVDGLRHPWPAPQTDLLTWDGCAAAVGAVYRRAVRSPGDSHEIRTQVPA